MYIFLIILGNVLGFVATLFAGAIDAERPRVLLTGLCTFGAMICIGFGAESEMKESFRIGDRHVITIEEKDKATGKVIRTYNKVITNND